MTNKRSVINFEAREFWLVHRAKYEVRSLCKECETETDWLTTEQAIVVSGLNAREIFRRVENGRLHFKEDAEGFLFVCAQSLAQKKNVS